MPADKGSDHHQGVGMGICHSYIFQTLRSVEGGYGIGASESRISREVGFTFGRIFWNARPIGTIGSSKASESLELQKTDHRLIMLRDGSNEDILPQERE
jgi:hypothetical protein